MLAIAALIEILLAAATDASAGGSAVMKLLPPNVIALAPTEPLLAIKIWAFSPNSVRVCGELLTVKVAAADPGADSGVTVEETSTTICPPVLIAFVVPAMPATSIVTVPAPGACAVVLML